MTMAEPLHSTGPPSQRPPSPTELSYTQLVKLTPLHGNNRRLTSAAGCVPQNTNLKTFAATSCPTAAAGFGSSAPRTAPPATMQDGIDTTDINVIFPLTVTSDDVQQTFRNSRTQSLQFDSSCGPKMTPLPSPTLNNLQKEPLSADRVANLAQKLHSQPIQSQSKQNDIRHFITMLHGMQHTVSQTVDEQQRNRKSQALNLLLSMFERLLEEKNESTDSEELNGLKEQIGQLQEDNERLHNFCRGRDDELTRLHQELEQINSENEELRIKLSRAQDECNEERKRAREAEMIASESESVRDGLFSSYGQLTEANVELERAMEECKAEKQALTRDLEYCREEYSQIESQCCMLREQLEDKDLLVAESEKKLDEMHIQLASHLQSLELANTHRHRLQDELHTSQRNATTASQHLLEIREQYTKLQKEIDANNRTQQSEQSENGNLTIRLQEEQLKCKDLEAQISKLRSREFAAQEQIRKLARTNAELKTKVNETNARLESTTCREKNFDTCSIISEMTLQKASSVSQDGAPSLLDYLKPVSS